MTAPCATTPDLFFSEDRHNIKRAKDICAECPARLGCLQLAIDGNEQYGIYGGMTPEERSGVGVAAPRYCQLPECGKRLSGKQKRFCGHLHSNRASARKRYVKRVPAA